MPSFALAFLFRAPYLADQSRHCESKVRLVPLAPAPDRFCSLPGQETLLSHRW
jgi:hypothetical protein